MATPIPDVTLAFKTVGFVQASKEVLTLTANLRKMQTAVKGSATALSSKNAALKSADRKLAKYDRDLTRITKQNKKLKDSLNEVSGKKGGGGFLGLNDSLTNTIKKIALWTLSTGIVFGTLRAFKASIEVIKDHNSSMINLRKVYSGADEDLIKIKKDVLEAAKSMKSLNQEAFDAAVTVARTGRTNLDVVRLTTTALIAQNIAELEVTDSVRFLNSALIQFKKDTTQAIRVLDQWNELSNRTPAETKHLAQAVSVAGSVFEQAGADIQFLNASTAALVEITAKSGNVVGRAERTMAIYAQRQKTVNLLSQIGIDVFDKQTQRFMTIDSLLTRVAAQWGNMTDKMKSAVAQAIAGTRQQQFFVALMENQELVMENLIIQWDSFGSAVRENEIFLQSIAKEFDGLINALERLAISAGDAGVAGIIKGQIKLLTDLVHSLELATKGTVALAAAGGVLTAAFIKSTKAGVTFTASLATIAKSLGRVALWIAAIEGSIFVFNKLASAGSDLLRVQNQLNDALEKQNQILTRQTSERDRLQSVVKTLKNLKTTRDALLKNGKATNQVDDQALRVLKALKDIYPELTEGMNNLNQAYETFNATLAAQARLVAEQKVSNLKGQLELLDSTIKSLEEKSKTERQQTKKTRAGTTGEFFTTTRTVGGLNAQEKADLAKLESDRQKAQGELSAAQLALANVGTAGPGGAGRLGLPASNEEQNLERRIELLRERQRIIQMTLDGVNQEQIIISNIASLEEKLQTLRAGSLEFEQTKLSLLQNELRLQQLLASEAQKFESIFSRGLGNIIASSLDSDDVRSATRSFVNSLGSQLSSEISKSVTKSLLADAASPFLAGLGGGIAGGLVSGIVGLITQSLFGKEDIEDKQTNALEENTIEIRALNSTIRDLTSTVFNAPAGFAVPASGGGFGQGGVESAAANSGTQTVINNNHKNLNIDDGAIRVTQRSGESGAALAARISGDLIDSFNRGGSSQSEFEV